jgi:hypothetical protein
MEITSFHSVDLSFSVVGMEKVGKMAQVPFNESHIQSQEFFLPASQAVCNQDGIKCRGTSG